MTLSQEISVENKSLLLSKSSSPFQVSLRLLELVTHLCFHTTRFGIRLVLNTFRRQRRSWQSLLGQSLAEMCESLGATFIKIGQILSTRYDLLPPEIIAPLVRLQDNIRPVAFQFVPEIILAQTGREIGEIFAEFEEYPISSASIASVYRAQLQNGQVVAVKIRRPSIVRKVQNDLLLMRLIARSFGRLRVMQLIPIVDMINDLGLCIEQQLDLRIEAYNTRRFQEMFRQEPDIHIPALVEGYCTEGMLVMEFIDDLVRIDALGWTQEEYQQALLVGLAGLYRMIFLDGFIHCDLHPGNLYFLKGGKVVILDAGFVARMSPEVRCQFAKFFLGIVSNDGKNCARIIYETASSQKAAFNFEGFEQAVIDLIDRNSGSKAVTFQVATFAYQIFDIQRRFGLRGSTSFTMAILSLLVLEGIAKQLYPGLDFQAAAFPFLLKAIEETRCEN